MEIIGEFFKTNSKMNNTTVTIYKKIKTCKKVFLLS